LPSSTQAEVLEAINKSFQEPTAGQEIDPEEDDVDPDALEDGDYEDDLLDGEEVEGAHQCVGEEPDANELFWDEFFDSLVITVPFTFLYILLDMWVVPLCAD